MGQDIYEGIVEPLDGYLSGYLTEKDVDWSELRWCARRNRREGAFWEVREALAPYYHKLIMADRDFFRNGNTATTATFRWVRGVCNNVSKYLEVTKSFPIFAGGN